MMDSLRQDLRFSYRSLFNRPLFAALAVSTLALGIGANTAVFSVVNAYLLRPLPFPNPQEIVLLVGSNLQKGFEELPFSHANFVDVREQSRSFVEVAAWTSDPATGFNLSVGDEPEEVRYALVSGGFFPVLDVKPLLGRTITARDDSPGESRVAVISHGLWERRFERSREIVGRSFTLDGQGFTVIGVMPPGFRFVRFPGEADVWIPLALDPRQGRRYSRGTRYLGVIARIKAGLPLEAARSEIATIAGRLESQYPQPNAGLSMHVVPLREQVVGKLRPALLILLGAVGFVLLIACANVAAMTLARGVSRRREIVVRAALGARRGRIIRALLTESLLLSLVGGIIGVLLSFWIIDLLSLSPYDEPGLFTPYRIPSESIGINLPVLAFAFGASLLTAILFGLWPAFEISRPDLTSALRSGSFSLSESSGRRTRDFIVVLEIALAFILLVGAGLMVKSVLRLGQTPPGFATENILALDLRLPRSKYSENQRVTAFYREALERIRGLRGVEGAGATSMIPLGGSEASTGIFIEGEPLPEPGQGKEAHNRVVTTDYFRTMAIPLQQGRFLTEGDNEDSTRVALINETMARRYFSGQSPIGKRVALDYESFRYYPDRRPDFDLKLGLREIIGVVGDVRHSSLDNEPLPEMYIPFLQAPTRELTIAVRTSADPGQLAEVLRREILSIDREQPVSRIMTAADLLANTLARPRSNGMLLSLFALLALCLASVGIFGVMSYSTTQRTREIGIRMALGADRSEVLRLILARGARLIASGIILGLAGALMLTRLLSGLLHDVRATDPYVYAVLGLLLAIVAMFACYLPARRACGIDPVRALRYE